MIPALYLATFVASLTALTGILLKNRRVLSMVVIFGIVVTVSSLGRYLISVSTTYEMARLSNLLLYVGSCYAPLVAAHMLAYLAKLELPRWFKIFQASLSSLVFLLVLTIGHCGIYYKSMELVREDGFSYLVKEYGPGHALYSLLLILYFFFMVYCLLQALRRRREVSIYAVVLIEAFGIAILGGLPAGAADGLPFQLCVAGLSAGHDLSVPIYGQDQYVRPAHQHCQLH